MVLHVECQTSDLGQSEPHVFRIGKRPVKIDQIVDRWLATDYRYFKVEADDDATYILRHNGRSGVWEMILYQAAEID